MRGKPDLNNFRVPAHDNEAWKGWQNYCCCEDAKDPWWSLEEFENDTTDFAIAQNNLGEWWAVTFTRGRMPGQGRINPAIGPFDSPQTVFATIRLME